MARSSTGRLFCPPLRTDGGARMPSRAGLRARREGRARRCFLSRRIERRDARPKVCQRAGDRCWPRKRGSLSGRSRRARLRGPTAPWRAEAQWGMASRITSKNRRDSLGGCGSSSGACTSQYIRNSGACVKRHREVEISLAEVSGGHEQVIDVEPGAVVVRSQRDHLVGQLRDLMLKTVIPDDSSESQSRWVQVAGLLRAPAPLPAFAGSRRGFQ